MWAMSVGGWIDLLLFAVALSLGLAYLRRKERRRERLLEAIDGAERAFDEAGRWAELVPEAIEAETYRRLAECTLYRPSTEGLDVKDYCTMEDRYWRIANALRARWLETAVRE